MFKKKLVALSAIMIAGLMTFQAKCIRRCGRRETIFVIGRRS